MSNFAAQTNSYEHDNRKWARSMLDLETIDVTLDGSKWTAGTLVPSGTPIGRVTASKLCAPYQPTWSDGTNKAIGLLLNDWVAAPGRHLVAAVVSGGPVDRRYLPSTVTSEAQADLPAIGFVN